MYVHFHIYDDLPWTTKCNIYQLIILQTEESGSQFYWECINHNVPQIVQYSSCVAAVYNIMYTVLIPTNAHPLEVKSRQTFGNTKAFVLHVWFAFATIHIGLGQEIKGFTWHKLPYNL